MEMVLYNEHNKIYMVNGRPNRDSIKDATLLGHSGEDSKATTALHGKTKLTFNTFKGPFNKKQCLTVFTVIMSCFLSSKFKVT